MDLPFGLVLTRALQKPETIVAQGRLRTHIEPGNLPAAGFLKNCGKSVRAFVAGYVLDNDPVLTRRQARDIELSVVRGSFVSAKDSAIESAVWVGRGAGIQQKRDPHLPVGPGNSRTVLRRRARNAICAGLRAGRDILPYGSDIAMAGLVKNVLRRCLNRGSDRTGNLVIGQAGLRPCGASGCDHYKG